MNEIDILGSYINNRVRTTYKDMSPDFSIINEEVNKNCCKYDAETNTITSDMYLGNDRKFVFDNVLLSGGEVPQSSDPTTIGSWVSKLSSLSLPITYIDIDTNSTYAY